MRHKPRRSKLKILVDILKVMYDEGETKITQILYGANLSYDRLVKYLEELESLGLIEKKNNHGSRYYLTKKGRDFLNEFKKIEKFVKAFGIEI